MHHLHDMLDGGWIERYHIKGQRMLTRQSISDHSWRMAAILFTLWPACRPHLIWATLFHDVSERVTGDMPSPVKNANADVARALNEITTAEERRLGIRFDLTAEEARMLGWLDRYEGLLHCLDEAEMGNGKIIGTLRRYVDASGNPKYALADKDVESMRSRLQEQAAEKALVFINRKENQ